MAIDKQYFLNKHNDLQSSKMEELEALRLKYMADCEAVVRKYSDKQLLLSDFELTATLKHHH